MTTCPNGHASSADDWCDVCGARIGGAPANGAGAPGNAASGTTGAPAASADAGEDDVTCPHCGITQDSGHRFCEVCGADMASAPTGAATATTAVTADPVSAPPTPDPATTPAATAAPPPASSGGRWEATVEADRAYFERLAADGVEFPVAAPVRTFGLVDANVLVGRRSARRGIDPQIDLAGSPEDPGVSHAHCTLVRQPDGSYAVVDNGSTNGTRVDEGIEPLTPNTPHALAEGARVHVGAWTTLTLHRR